MVEAVGVEEAEPEVAQWCAFRHCDVFTELEGIRIARNESWRVVQMVNGVDVGAIAKGGGLEKRSARGIFC